MVHRLLQLFSPKMEQASTEAKKPTVHISDTERVWVDPREVVKTDAFQQQVAAVRRLRLAHEKANPCR